MNSKMIQSVIVAVVGVALIHGSAGVASATTVYEDNFDNVAAGSLPSPQVGTIIPGGSAKAGDSITAPVSAPNYLDSDRTVSGKNSFYGDLAGAPLTPGTIVHVEAMVNNRSGSNFPTFGLISTGDITTPHTNDGIIIISAHSAGTVYGVDSTGALQAVAGLTSTVDTWEKWEIDYVVGASSYTLTVAGTPVVLGTTHMVDDSAAALASVYSASFSSSAHVLLDDILITAVPEPASLMLLGAGGLMLLRRRRGM